MSTIHEASSSVEQQQPSTSHAVAYNGGYPVASTQNYANNFATQPAHSMHQQQPLTVATSSTPYADGNWIQQPPPGFYYHPTGPPTSNAQPPGQMPPQRSPHPGHSDGVPPSSQAPQIVVPRQNGSTAQPMPQHSPAARRPTSGPPPTWPPMPQGDPNDPNAQGHHLQQAPMMHPGYPPSGMPPPPQSGYWNVPPHQQRYPGQYPGDPSFQQPPHMMHSGGPPNVSGHPYYLQVPTHHQHAPTSTASQSIPTSNGNEDEETRRRLQQPNLPPNVHHVSPGYPQQPQPGMHPSMHPAHSNIPGQPPPQMMPPPGMGMQSHPINVQQQQYSKSQMLKPQQREAVEKLVGQPSDMVPPQAIPQRRNFFEQLVLLNDQQGKEPLTAAPQVSKTTVDLHRLYIAVRRRGGFEQVTKDKMWKQLCVEANPRMTESSAAGYQLRRHYLKYLLALECQETGQNKEDLEAFADKLKKKKKEKEPTQPSTPGAPGSVAGPPTPSSIRSAATPTPQHTQQQQQQQQPPPQPSPSSSVGAAPARMSPFPGMHGPPQNHGPPAGYPHPNGDPNAAAYYYAQQQQHAAMAAQQQGLGPPPQHMAPPGTANWPPHQPGAMQPPRFAMPGKLQQMPPVSSAADFRRPQPPPGSMGTPNPPTSYFPPMHASSPSMPSPGSAQQRQMQQPPTNQPIPNTPASASNFVPQPQQVPSQPVPSTTNSLPSTGPPQQSMATTASPFPHSNQQPGASTTTNATPAPSFMHSAHQQPQQISNGTFGQISHHHQPMQPHPNTRMNVPFGHQQPSMISAGQFPPQSLESLTRTAINKRRPRMAARDYAAIPTQQLCMALRCGQQMELTFALNALTALLYDDTHWPPLQLANEPQLLSLITEHLRATLAILYPKVFTVNSFAETLPDTYEFDPNAFDEKPYADVRTEKLNGKDKSDLSRKSSLVDASNFQLNDDEKIAGLSTKLKASQQTASGSNHVLGNYTLRTRTNRRVYVERRAQRPLQLERYYRKLQKNDTKTENDCEIPTSELRRQMELGTGSSIADRVYHNLQTALNARKSLKRRNYSMADLIAKKRALEEEIEVDDEQIESNKTVQKTEHSPEFFYRKAHPWEVWDRFAKPDCSLLSRQVPVMERDPTIQELTDRALCLSNILRGFAQINGNEQFMHINRPLLYVLGRILMLMVGEDEQQRQAREEATVKSTSELKESIKKEPSTESMETISTNGNPEVATNSKETDVEEVEMPVKPRVCSPERDSDDKLLMETANSLRDDAFVILAQLSQFTDLYGFEAEITHPLLDALLHWAVTTNVQAQDPIAPGIISPRAYVFEIVSKYSLLERNVDLLLSTGTWPRLEEFVRVVCNFISMAEELPTREFAIVILNAISAASEPVCLVAAQETSVIHSLISFLEIAEQNMATIASTDGLDALRDNPERIGTSIPMLRRVAQILVNFVHHELCREPFKVHENKLLSLAVSHVMDSQVANKLTNVLYEIQQTASAVPDGENQISDDEYERLAAMFPSCNWRITDDEQPPPVPDASILKTNSILQPITFVLNIHSIDLLWC
ncbi:hypothetical protein M3Y96_00022800 [Aphelenchoides besseyi]|nr:hypothetical protein M3Y96_00022800 [Aphelenchoides besseyi]